MMELGINLEYVKKTPSGEKRSTEAAACLCRETGFLHLDYSGDYRSDDWGECARRDRAILDEAGLTVEQSHAPFNRYRTFAPEVFPEYLSRSFRVAQLLGARYVVVHADEYRPADRWDAQDIARRMYELYAPQVDFCKKYGMSLAVENLFEDRCYPEVDGRSRFTARVEEVLMLIERFNDPAVCCCWDFGHANCAYDREHILDAFRLAAPYIRCTHVHDNYYGKDLHLMPFLGNIDWAAHMRILAGVHYPGKLTYEFVYGQLTDGLLPDFLRLAHQAGETLKELAGK